MWAFVPDRTFEGYVNDLPAKARRLDTGEWVADVERWANACGYWDPDAPGVLTELQKAKPWRTALTTEEVSALVAAFSEAVGRRNVRRQYVEEEADKWALQKDVFVDWLDQLAPYTPPPPSQVTNSLTYLYEQEQRLTRTVVAATDFMFAIAGALLVELEQSETFHPPGTIL